MSKNAVFSTSYHEKITCKRYVLCEHELLCANACIYVVAAGLQHCDWKLGTIALYTKELESGDHGRAGRADFIFNTNC